MVASGLQSQQPMRDARQWTDTKHSVFRSYFLWYPYSWLAPTQYTY